MPVFKSIKNLLDLLKWYFRVLLFEWSLMVRLERPQPAGHAGKSGVARKFFPSGQPFLKEAGSIDEKLKE